MEAQPHRLSDVAAVLHHGEGHQLGGRQRVHDLPADGQAVVLAEAHVHQHEVGVAPLRRGQSLLRAGGDGKDVHAQPKQGRSNDLREQLVIVDDQDAWTGSVGHSAPGNSMVKFAPCPFESTQICPP